MNRYAQRVAELTNEDVNEINKKEVKPLSEEDLQDIENQLGQPLPADYREFLGDYAGVWLGPNQCRRAALYHLGDYHWGRASIGFFYDGAELLREQKDNKEYGYIPPELITIGEDGNVRLFLAIKGEYTGSVYQWYPSVFPENLSYYPELELVARSFEDFISMLQPLEDGFYEKKEHYEQERKEISTAREKLLLIEPRAENAYSQIMADLNALFVYATLGEDSKLLSEFELQNIEREIGYPLPSDYREFLRSFGGYSFIPSPRFDGYFCPAVKYPCDFPEITRMTDAGYYMVLEFFHGNMPNDYHDLLSHYHRLKDYLPAGMLPIADGGRLCLQLVGANLGGIFQINGKVAEYTPDEGYVGPSSPRSIDHIAPSFGIFMSSLQIRST